MADLTVDILELATIIDMGEDWTRKHWREIEGLPQPFIGRGKHQHARWRRAEINAFMAGQKFPPAEQAAATAARPAPTEKDQIVNKLLQGL
jgi:hypothetical protein